MRFLSTLAASVLGTLIAFGLVFFIGLVFLFGLAAAGDATPAVRTGSILVADLSGAWPEAVSGDPLAAAFGGEARLDLHDVTGAFRKAASDPRIEGVWVRIGSPASGWASLDAVRRAIESLRETGKPVYATSADYFMAENGYFLASAADSVFLEEEALFEFNGFSLEVLFYHRMFEKLGVEPQAIRAGSFKGAVEPFTRDDLSLENELQLGAIARDTEERFVSAVASRRGIDAGALRALMQEGGTFTAREALEHGLVDGMAYKDEVEDLFRRRLGQDDGERLRTVSLATYARVPAEQAGIRSSGRDEIAVVMAEGDIVAGKGGISPLGGSGALGSETLIAALRDAREAESVKAVVLRINSPGGFAPAADAMLREIELLRAEKPVFVSMGDLAASGGYWIATAADTVVAEALTLTGSIGVFSLMFDGSGLLEDRLGITSDVVTTAPSADMMSMLRPLTAAETARLEASIDRTYANFLDKVASARGMTPEAVDAVAQGRVWTGTSAVDAGLVDVLGGLDTAVALAAERVGLAEGAYRIREFPRKKTFVEQLTESLEGRALAFAAARGPLAGLAPADPVVRALADLRRLSAGGGSVQARLPFSMSVR